MNIEQYQQTKTWMFRCAATLAFAIAISAFNVGCRGTAPSFSQAFNSLGAPARVPPPAQGSFQVPNSYSGGVGSPANPGSSGLGGSSFGNGPKTSQNTLPTSNLFNSFSNAQTQILSATNNARNSVNRAADGINSGVEQASARVDRLGQGVSQASAILSEAATAPIVNADDLPMTETGNSGRIGDMDTSGNANWQTPIKR